MQILRIYRSAGGCKIKSIIRFFKQSMILVILVLAFSSCDSDNSNINDQEFRQNLSEESIILLEEFAAAVSSDCDATIEQWSQIDPGLIPNNIIAYRPDFDMSHEERSSVAYAQIQDGITRCMPESDFSNLDIVTMGSTFNCNSMCPISGWDCAYWWMACLAGDNQACCYSGACTGNCIDTCEQTDGCQNVNPNGPNGPPDGGS